ncbi:hypothetical protein JF732_21585 [Mycobacterium intracellulare]|uniref:hypothetical protein n=1 Tax=Mycobacterium intracellulare TaxID=1767 RepID=UPI001CD9D618|nr:hypothetical protein [Mycobacterium intracellulare]MCA2322555.1 hypothetical protein [Mycobacterium intracellulare]MCA2343126.1 hypothetical protein [Mycobacterium intracellulare]MDV6978033.1 hypothetical protein [Mycobacterium intracellulare]MDV6983447.1 hypothetical protein [Mycobacterium intracellulare]MDV7027126.1 hypothetical protein [Mycobacterium intracellulare]
MTRLRITSLVVAAAAGGYAALTLIGGQLNDFGVSIAVCAASLAAAALSARVANRRRQAMARGRAAVWQRRDQEVAAAGQNCPLCGGASQKPSDSPRFVDRQLARLCAACAPT